MRCLVGPERCPVEPLVHAPQTVESACIGRVGIEDGAVLERERAAGHVVRPEHEVVDEQAGVTYGLS
jgi:hypothetical protein